MKKQEIKYIDSNEFDYLNEVVGLDEKDIYILSYLKNLNRNDLKELSKNNII